MMMTMGPKIKKED